jgi:hypothetical protein
MRISVLLAILAFSLTPASAAELTPEQEAQIGALTESLEPTATPTGALTIVESRDRNSRRVRPMPMGLAGGLSCNVGVFQLGDSTFAADRVARLENSIARANPGRTGELIVRRYDIYLNRSQEEDAASLSGAMASRGIFGVGGRVDYDDEQIWREPKCQRHRMSGGWFSPEDLSNNYPPITIEIEVTAYGQVISVNAAMSPPVNPSSIVVYFPAVLTQTAPSFEAFLQLAMDRAHDRVVEAVRTAPAN